MPAFPVENTQSAYLLIGSITAHWSYVEMGVDQMIHAIYARFNGKIIQPLFPGPFKTRMDFLRKAAQLPALRRFKADLLSFEVSASNISGERHRSVHGAIMNVAPDDVVSMEAFKLRKGVSELKRADVTLAQFNELNTRIVALAEVAARLANGLIKFASTLPSK